MTGHSILGTFFLPMNFSCIKNSTGPNLLSLLLVDSKLSEALNAFSFLFRQITPCSEKFCS